jgi:hypothetical protein
LNDAEGAAGLKHTAQLAGALQVEADRDPLTGLRNRRATRRELDAALAADWPVVAIPGGRAVGSVGLRWTAAAKPTGRIVSITGTPNTLFNKARDIPC